MKSMIVNFVLSCLSVNTQKYFYQYVDISQSPRFENIPTHNAVDVRNADQLKILLHRTVNQLFTEPSQDERDLPTIQNEHAVALQCFWRSESNASFFRAEEASHCRCHVYGFFKLHYFWLWVVLVGIEAAFNSRDAFAI